MTGWKIQAGLFLAAAALMAYSASGADDDTDQTFGAISAAGWGLLALTVYRRHRRSS